MSKTNGRLSIPAWLRRAAAALMVTLLLTVAGCGLDAGGSAADFDGLVRQAVNEYKQGDSAAAERLLRTAARMGQEKPEIYAGIASRLSQLGRPGDGAAFLATSLKDKKISWDPSLWELLRETATQAGDARRAETARVEAEARANIIMARIGNGAEVKDAPWASPGVPFLRAGFYFLAAGVRDPGAAIRALQEALRLEPDNPVMMNALGYTLADEGKTEEEFQEALELTQKAVSKSPNTPEFIDSLGWALFKNNDLEGARRYLQQAVDKVPEEPELRYHLGVILAQQGATEDAKLEFERALRLKPDYTKAEEAIKHLKAKPGEGIVQGA